MIILRPLAPSTGPRRADTNALLPDTDSPETLSSNILSNNLLKMRIHGIVKAQAPEAGQVAGVIVFKISDVPPKIDRA